MTDYVRENRKAVIAVAVLAGLFVVALVVFMTRSGGDPNAEGTLVEHAPSASPSPDDTLPETPTSTTTSRSVTRGAGANPFVPLTEPSADPTDNSGTGATNKSGSTKPGQSRDSQPAGSDSSSASNADTSGSQSKDAAKKRTPKDLAPQPIEKGGDASNAVAVTVIDVHNGYVLARVNGQRTTLYLNVPDPSAMMYVSPLGGACAWIARTDGDTGERVSICEGETQDL